MSGADWGDPISVYTRADAIDDGVLVDVTDIAARVGLTLHTVLTVNAYDSLGCEDAQRAVRALQAIAAAMEAPSEDQRVDLVLPGPRGAVSCYALAHRGDEHELVLTVMCAGED